MTQDNALAILQTGANVFLTGEPGSGKTHTVNRYVAWLRERGIEPALTASTGIAATHIGGMTIHSWSGIGIKDMLSSWDLERIANTERNVKRIGSAKVLIIDEVSMLDGRTLAMVDEVCRAIRRDSRAFGGLQTVLVGDFFQLPPVTRGAKPVFAWQGPTWKWFRPMICYLTEQHRQDDTEFLGVLSAIRSNAMHEDHFRILETRVSSPIDAPAGAVKLFAHNVDVDKINEQELSEIKGTPRSFKMTSMGPDHLQESLKRGCLSPEMLWLKVGASVMFTRNDMQGRFVNGSLGTVEDFHPTSSNPMVRLRGGALVEAEPMGWSIDDQGKVLAALLQVPLRLAWAMTIHKSQGMSLDCALMDLSGAFEYGQGYVALSRVRRLDGLYLLGCNQRATQVHPEVLAQDMLFREESSVAEEAISALTPDELAERHGAFVNHCGGRPPSEVKPKKARKARAKKQKTAA